jgi:hypothetical protein
MSTSFKYYVETEDFEASVADGDAVYWHVTNGEWTKAIADGSVADRVGGVADVTNGQVTLFGSHTAGLAGLTPGAWQYLSNGTAGGLVEVQPNDTIKVGVAKSAGELWVDIDVIHQAAPPEIASRGPTINFTAPGTYTYTPLENILGVEVQVWGGGGSGGANSVGTGSLAGYPGATSSFGSFLTTTGGGGAFANRIGGDAGTASASPDVSNAMIIGGTVGGNGSDPLGIPGFPGGVGGAAFGAPGGAGGGGVGVAGGTPSRNGVEGAKGMFPGGGGGGQGTNGTSGGLSCGGGGGGGYVRGWIPKGKLPTSVTVTVGTGGAAVSALTGAGADGCVIVTEVY